MAKSTRSPLEKFMAESLKMARNREQKKGWVSDKTLTIDVLVGLYYGQEGKCIHTGETMTLVRGLKDEAVVPTLCTIDRIDNTKGYTPDNIMLACDGINRMRGEMELKQFRKLCKLIGAKA
jgi:hypothetical protein